MTFRTATPASTNAKSSLKTSTKKGVGKTTTLHLPQGLPELYLTSINITNSISEDMGVSLRDVRLFIKEGMRSGINEIGKVLKGKLRTLRQQTELHRIFVACIEVARPEAIVQTGIRDATVGKTLRELLQSGGKSKLKAVNFVKLFSMTCFVARTGLLQGHPAATAVLKDWAFQMECLACGNRASSGMITHAGRIDRFIDVSDSVEQRRSFGTLSSMKRAITARMLPKNAEAQGIKGYVTRMLDPATKRIPKNVLKELEQFAYEFAKRAVGIAGDIPETGSINDKACLESSRTSGGTREHMRRATGRLSPLLRETYLKDRHPSAPTTLRNVGSAEKWWSGGEYLADHPFRDNPGRYFLDPRANGEVTDPPGVEGDLGRGLKTEGQGALKDLREMARFAKFSFSTRILARSLCLRSEWLQDNAVSGMKPIETEPFAIKERGLKVRVASKFPAVVVVIAQRINTSLLKMLTADRAYFQDDVSNLGDMLGKGTPDRMLYSADLSTASDLMQFSANRAILNGIWRGAREALHKKGKESTLWDDDNVLESALEMVSSQQIIFDEIAGFPEESGQIRREIRTSASKGATTQGAPMGLGLAWPVLSIMHRFCTVRNISIADRKRVALKGDDALLHFTQKSYKAYVENLEILGLRINSSKTHQSKTGGIFCGKFVHVVHGRATIVSTPKMSAILLAKRQGETAESLTTPTEVALGPALRAEVKHLPPDATERVMKTVQWYHWWMLKRMRKTGIPLCWPRALGGFDMPGRCEASTKWKKASANYVSGFTGKSGNPIAWGALWTMDDQENALHRNSRRLADAALEKVPEVTVTQRGKGGSVREASVEDGEAITVTRTGGEAPQPRYLLQICKTNNVVRDARMEDIAPEPEAGEPMFEFDRSLFDVALDLRSETFDVQTNDTVTITKGELTKLASVDGDVLVGFPERRLRTALVTSIESRLRQTSIFSSQPPKRVKAPKASPPHGGRLPARVVNPARGKTERRDEDHGDFQSRVQRVLSVAHRLFKSRPGVNPVNDKTIRPLATSRRGYGERLLSVQGVLNICVYLDVDFHQVVNQMAIDEGRPPIWARLDKSADPNELWSDWDGAETLFRVQNNYIQKNVVDPHKVEKSYRDASIDHGGLMPELGEVRGSVSNEHILL